MTILLINPEKNIYVLQVDALPEPSDRAYAMAARRTHKLFNVHDDGWDRHFRTWEVGKRRPRTKDRAELRWIAKNAPDAKVTCDQVFGNTAHFVITFATKDQSLMFKLTFGGASVEPLAFAA